MTGSLFKFHQFPMPYIAGPSSCQKVVYSAPANVLSKSTGTDNKLYTVSSWIATSPNCTETVKVDFAF